VGKLLGLQVRCVLTDMSQPLGVAVGNALEIIESVEVLQGHGPSDIRDLSIELLAQMLLMSEKCSSLVAAKVLARRTLQSGVGFKKFLEMAKAQGASAAFLGHPTQLELGPDKLTIAAKKSGFIAKLDALSLGNLVIALGGGREKASDKIDPAVGLKILKKVGHSVSKDQALVEVYFNHTTLKQRGYSESDLENWIQRAVIISKTKPTGIKLVKKVISGS
jgi:pyrimidine-nucleoside phosphorylase